jgi:hypothetical protein
MTFTQRTERVRKSEYAQRVMKRIGMELISEKKAAVLTAMYVLLTFPLFPCRLCLLRDQGEGL